MWDSFCTFAQSLRKEDKKLLNKLEISDLI